MSYLLDALNKSKGEQTTPTDTPQPVVYHGFAPAEGPNIYKWISIVLALILTLILGIVLGNKYALLGVPAQQPMPVPVQKPVVQSPAPTQSVKTATVKAEPKPEPEPEPEPVTRPGLQQNDQEFHVVSGEPKKLKPVKELKDTGLDNISNDLLNKFNQAIKDSEGVEADYSQLQSEQTDQELEAYFTKVPTVTELNTQQQLKVPTMVYETHLYSSDKLQRWVKINGKTMQEQQWINGDIQIIEIQKQFLILQMGHIRFSLPALTDWQAIN